MHKLLALWRIGAIFRKTQLEIMLKYLDIGNAHSIYRVFDVGCGHGLVDLEILERRPNVNLVLLDLSFEDLLIAKTILSTHSVDIVQASATHLPFRSNIFDRVLMSSVLQHIPNYLDALKEVSRVLRVDGVFVVNVPGDKPYMFLPKILGEKVIKLLFHTFNMYHVFKPRDLFANLRRLGFKIVDYRYVPSLFSMFVFELIAFLMILEKIRRLRLTRLSVLLSLLFPVTSLIEKVLRLSTGTEYIAKAVKVR